MKIYKTPYFYRLVYSTLAVSAALTINFPLLAQVSSGTAGLEIKNTATGTFKDESGTEYNTTSNEIVISIAEVAGIIVTAQSPSKTNPNVGETLYVDFVITNKGNDSTQFFIPDTITTSDNTKLALDGKIKIVKVGSTDVDVEVPSGGGTTGNLLGTTQGAIAPDGTITVRVPLKVLPGAITGDNLTVTLGNTTAAPNNQNQPRTNNDGNDVYTVDNADGTDGETNGTPINGVREAMDTSTNITIGARQQAFATILKAVSSYVNNNTSNVFTDDVLTYGLALRVEANPNPLPNGITPADLRGTKIRVGTADISRVLVSDAIPEGTVLGATANIIAPNSNWQIVYTTSPLTITAEKATWETQRPASGITRVGFIYDASTTAIPRGTTVEGFRFAVNPDANFKGGQVNNIAQVFGQSQEGDAVPGTPTQIVYDESGDQTSNNGLDGKNPDPNTAGGTTPANGGISDGKADPNVDGVDPGKGNNPNGGDTNTGIDKDKDGNDTTDGGEVTVYIIAATPLNGPKDKPTAVGPTDNNDDFTNKSIVVPPNTPPDTKIDPNPFTFDNSVQNTSSAPQEITLVPTPPANRTDLLDGTKVTIVNPVTNTTVEYTYNQTTGTFTTTATTPIRVTILPGGEFDYQVIVDLPEAPQFVGYPVPVTAFIDGNNDGKFDANEPGNTTIDRLYTNYLRLDKKARILEANGTPVTGGAGDFATATTANLAAAANPGRIIEYQITYTNVSTTGSGDNVILPAKDLVITEDGNAGNNTWFNLTTDPQYPTNSKGSANPAANTTVTPVGNNIQIYVNNVGDVAPQATGNFTFQRKINEGVNGNNF